MYASYYKHTLDFKFLAGTSRGVLRHKDSYFIKVSQDKATKLYGIGECAPLQGLSIDDVQDYEQKLQIICERLSTQQLPADEASVLELVEQLVEEKLPSIRFGLEMALLDLLNGGKQQLMKNAWSQNPFQPIPINGLIWMNDKSHMMEQLKEKLDQGFDCIKVKIGAIDFDQEMELLSYIRQHYSAKEVTVRVDANGAFGAGDVFKKLDRLAEFDVHSIEQPVKAGQPMLMRKVCAQSPVPVALDEELIGITGLSPRTELIDQLLPKYMILKPSLLGGISACREWIRIAEERNIGWWITSALESNVGLNAIAQFTATFTVSLPQGLGTGQLFHNNIASPLVIENGRLMYRQDLQWNFKSIIS